MMFPAFANMVSRLSNASDGQMHRSRWALNLKFLVQIFQELLPLIKIACTHAQSIYAHVHKIESLHHQYVVLDIGGKYGSEIHVYKN